jgi:septum formation protein
MTPLSGSTPPSAFRLPPSGMTPPSAFRLPPSDTPPRLILASRSPRRALLLRDAGYTFTQADPPFDDPPQPDKTADPAALAMELALAKARSVADHDRAAQREPTIVLGADTVVVAPDGLLLGQPADRTDAERMLRLLLGRFHEVISAVALVMVSTRVQADPGGHPRAHPGAGARTLVDHARVRFGPISEPALASYLDGGEWRGKAGAYNLSELQNNWAFEVIGDPETVVGLPMAKLRPILAELGLTPAQAQR